MAELKSGRLDAGADALRLALESGARLGNDLTEYPFRRRANALMVEGHPRAALRYAQMATEFAPSSWRTHADLAEIWRALEEPAAARKAQTRAESLNSMLKREGRAMD